MPLGMTLIDGPIPNKKDFVWDSSDLDGDSIPLQESQRNPDVLWWCIHEENANYDMFMEMLKWCKENCQYQSVLRYDDKDPYHNPDGYVIAYFRHPDDAMAFKLTWT